MTKFLEALLIILFWLTTQMVGRNSSTNEKGTAISEAVHGAIILVNLGLLAWVIAKVLVG